MRQSTFRMWSGSVWLMFVAAVCCSFTPDPSRPRYIGCQSSDECGKDSCCVIGMGRYSIPQCKPRQELGETCRPVGEGEPVNTTLHYPDGASVDLAGVYYITCPCHGGLVCGGSMECVDQVSGNHVDEQNDYSEENNFHY